MEAILEFLYKERRALESAQAAYLRGESAASVLAPIWDLLSSSSTFLAAVDNLTSPCVEGCMRGACGPKELEISREKGKKAFAAKDFSGAITHYTDCLANLDETAGAEQRTAASQLHCNRALCLLKMEPPRAMEALEDCHVAVALDPSSAKARFRRAAAQETIGDLDAAAGDARAALERLPEGSADARGVEELLRRLMQPRSDTRVPGRPSGDEGEGQPEEEALSDAEEIKWKEWPHSLIESLGRGRVKAEHSNESGWGLVAAAPLCAATDLWREEPLVMVIAKASRRKVCWECLRPLPSLAPVPCPRCRLASFCSLRCREAAAAWGHEGGGAAAARPPRHDPHGAECGLPWAQVLPENAVLGCKIASAVKGGGRRQGLGGAMVESLERLEHHFGARQELRGREGLARAATLACVAAACHNAGAARGQMMRSRGNGNAVREAGHEGGTGAVEVSAADVLCSMLKVEVNGIAVVPPERSSAAGSSRLAIAIYPRTSLLNHACVPSAGLHFDGASVILRCLADVSPGDALQHCYGPQHGEMTAADRQDKLMSQYNFSCNCRACRDKGGPYAAADAKLNGLRCRVSGCRGAVRVDPSLLLRSRGSSSSSRQDVSIPAGVLGFLPVASAEAMTTSPRRGYGVCTTCRDEMGAEELSEAVEKAQAAARLAQGAEAAMQGQRADGASELESVRLMLDRALQIRQRFLHQGNQLVGDTHDSIARVAVLQSELKAGAENCRAALECICQGFESRSPAEGFQRAALADIMAASGDLDTAAIQAEVASDILELHFGTCCCPRRDEMLSVAAGAAGCLGNDRLGGSEPQVIKQARARIMAWAGGAGTQQQK